MARRGSVRAWVREEETLAEEFERPHDKLFRAVFSEAREAAGLLRTALPPRLREGMDWQSLKLLEGNFLDDALRESESDLLYEVAQGDKGERVWLYLLLEHQSTPDAWMRFRLLKYCCRIWEAGIRDRDGERELRPIMPLVFYQGSRGWTHSTEFADLFPEAARRWPWVPRFEHVLLDQTDLEPGAVAGEVKGRIAQLLMMAACGRHGGSAVEMAAQLSVSLHPGGGLDYFRLFVRYVMATQDEAGTKAFGEALRRHGREQGGEIMSYAQQLLEEGEQRGRAEGREEGREEGEQRGKLKAVEGMLRAGVTWDVIEEATGLNESGFQALKEQLSAPEGRVQGEEA